MRLPVVVELAYPTAGKAHHNLTLFSLVIMLVTVLVVLLAVSQALAFNAPRLGGRRQHIEIRKNELSMVQLRLPTGLGLPSPSSWMSGYLRAIESHNDALQISPRRGKQ